MAFDCPKGPVATFLGDPHLQSLDGVRFDFQATGEFVLLDTPSLHVQSRFEQFGPRPVSMTAATALRIGSHVVEIIPADQAADGSLPALLDGNLINLDPGGVWLDDGSFVGQDPASPRTVVAVAPDGSYVRVYNEGSHQDIEVGARPGVETSGLLGVADGDRANDLTMRGGEVVPTEEHGTVSGLYERFGNSWRVTDAERLFTDGSWSDYQTAEYLRLPEGLLSLASFEPAERDEANRLCVEAGIPDGHAAENCAFDYLVTGDRAWIEAAASSPIVQASAARSVAAGSAGADPSGESGGEEAREDRVFQIALGERITKEHRGANRFDVFEFDAGPGSVVVELFACGAATWFSSLVAARRGEDRRIEELSR